GSYQAAVGQDYNLGLSQSSVACCSSTFTKLILEKMIPIHIQFPTSPAEKQRVMEEYICDAKGRIISVNPNFPGSTHDAAVWRASQLHRFLERQYIDGQRSQWLLGDKGYPLLPWRMTPHPAATAESPEERYNKCHTTARNIIEMTFGRLKNKFRCLLRHRILHFSPEKAADIIVPCCTLYNTFIDVLAEIKGFDAFDKYTKSIDDNVPPVLFYFSGAKLPDGNSWCPDCVEGPYLPLGQRAMARAAGCEGRQTKSFQVNSVLKFPSLASELKQSDIIIFEVYRCWFSYKNNQPTPICIEPMFFR
ncbi:putative nuclease HARBI1, partial [Operophtera brumata]